MSLIPGAGYTSSLFFTFFLGFFYHNGNIPAPVQPGLFACPAMGQVSWDPPVGNFVYVLMLTSRYLPHVDTAMQITAQQEWR